MRGQRRGVMGRFEAQRVSLTGQIAPNAPRIGRLMRQIKRALIAANGQPLGISTLLSWCYPRARKHPHWHWRNINRTIRKIALPVEPTRKRFASRWVLK